MNLDLDMTSRWQGDIQVGDGQYVRGLSITTSGEEYPHLPQNAALRFLSIVETSQIPLFLAVGGQCNVTTSDEETERWLSSILLSSHNSGDDDGSPWWMSAQVDSPLGILVAVDHYLGAGSGSKVTEVLLYASHDLQHMNETQTASTERPQCPSVHSARLLVYAQPLCSDRISNGVVREPTPPYSPEPDEKDIEAVFLPPATSKTTDDGEIINLPPVRKRKTVNETFDEAAERRRKVRRKGGEGVAAAAASRNPADVSQRPTSHHRRSTSNSQNILLQNRPLSRASSVGSSRVADLREPSLPALSKRSSLGRVQSVASPGAERPQEEEPTLEQKNKEIISKIVMAGMRLYGLVQGKTRKSRANSAAASPVVDTSFEDIDAERQKDEEYKLVYHQVYKGTCFALRQHISVKSLQPHTEALRETVDKLLTIFCNDPLLVEGDLGDDGLTPGGRKAFGSSAVAASGHKNPFLEVGQTISQSNTPCGRKPSERDKGKYHD